MAVCVLLVVLPKLLGRDARLRRRLRAVKQRAIRDLAEPVPARSRIAGMVVPMGEPLVAPLSGRPCVFYETRVERTMGLGVSTWDIEYEIAAEKRCVPFLLDDGTGIVAVDVRHADMLLGKDVGRWAGEEGSDVAREDAFLARRGQRRRGWFFEKRLYFMESIIEVGERIAVVGEAHREHEASSAQRDPYRRHPETSHTFMSGSRRSPLLVSDDPRLSPPLDDA